MMVPIHSTALFAKHEICILGNEVLRTKAAVIENFDEKLKQRAETMFEIMEASGNGIGLAAPQIGRSERLVVAEVKMPPLDGYSEEQKEVLRKKISELSKTIVRTNPDGTETKFKDIIEFGRFVFANPVIEALEEAKEACDESCLSLPGIAGQVLRYKKILLRYQDLDGHPCTLECDGFLAQIIQHETDHLNGILYVDHIPDLWVLGEDPIWKKFPSLYEQIKALKDEDLTATKLEELKQKAAQRGFEFKPSERMFWISKENKEKALKIIEAIGGEKKIFDYDMLFLKAGTADSAVEAKSEAK